MLQYILGSLENATICSRFFRTGFHSSDRGQYSDGSRSNYRGRADYLVASRPPTVRLRRHFFCLLDVYKTWFLTLKEEHRLRVFLNMMLRA
jgi:hypothetical protein